MFLAIGSLLNADEVAGFRKTAASLNFVDGRATAGRIASEVKANDQAAASPELDDLLVKAGNALLNNSVFAAAARPRRLGSLLLSRYRTGQAYGAHVDNAIMGGSRSDISFTLFLSEPDSYAGGALIVQDGLAERSIRLAAGDVIVYPSNTLHRVEPVSSGERFAVVGWVTSWVREPEKRAVLFDLDQSLKEIHDAGGKSPLFDRLSKTKMNLLRMWAEG